MFPPSGTQYPGTKEYDLLTFLPPDAGKVWYIVGQGPLWFLQVKQLSFRSFFISARLHTCFHLQRCPHRPHLPHEHSSLKIYQSIYQFLNFDPQIPRRSHCPHPQVLLLFNLAFCWFFPKGLDSLPKNLPFPGFFGCVVMGTVLGLAQWWIVENKFRLWDVPIVKGGGGLPFQIVFFFAGALAKRNDWLEAIMGMGQEVENLTDVEKEGVADGGFAKQKARQELYKSTRTIWMFRLHALIGIALLSVYSIALSEHSLMPYHSRCSSIRDSATKVYVSKTYKADRDFGEKLPSALQDAFPYLKDAELKAGRALASPKPNPSPPSDKLPDPKNSKAQWWSNFVRETVRDSQSWFWNVVLGQMSFTLAFCSVQLFSTYANFELPGFLKSMSSEAAYGVYVFHWLVYPLVLWFFLYFFLPAFYRGGEGATNSGEVDTNAVVGTNPATNANQGAVNPPLTFFWCSNQVFASDTRLPQGGLVLAFLWTVVVTNGLLWPGVWFLRKWVPGVDKVL